MVRSVPSVSFRASRTEGRGRGAQSSQDGSGLRVWGGDSLPVKSR